MTRADGLSRPLAVLVWLLSGVGLSAHEPSLAAVPARICRGIVFMVNGAGGFQASSRSVSQAIAETQLPLEVRCFRWTHGFCRVASDQMHTAHLQRSGHTLAEQILICRHESPEAAIFLIGHSAGCGVVLTAAETLPPSTLERIILLAPAVSAQHDLRPALRSACQGIDVFISSHDWACLGLGTLLLGTTDRYWMSGVAGKVGFKPVLTSPEDAVLYSKLRHYPWNPSLVCTGHNGGHYGSYQPAFLRTCVIPLLVPVPAVSASISEPRP
jgi:predicted esterase